MKRSKSSKNAAIPPRGVVVCGVKLDMAERAGRFSAFVVCCEETQREMEIPWRPPCAATRKKYRYPGRPPAFPSPEAFYDGILAYFEECDNHTTAVIVNNRTDGAKVINLPDPMPKGVKALCIFLGISRQTFYRYLDPEHEFSVVADWFGMVSEMSWYDLLMDPKRAKLAQIVLQAKHGHVVQKDVISDGQAIGSPLGRLLDEIDGSGFVLPCHEEGADGAE